MKPGVANGQRPTLEPNQTVELAPLMRTGLKCIHEKDPRNGGSKGEATGRYSAESRSDGGGGTYTKEESPPFTTNIEHFCSVQEKVGLCTICETRCNLLNASFQDFRVEHGAIGPGEASPVWRSVERASGALVGMASILYRLITTMGVISSVFRHSTDLEEIEKREGPNSRWESFLTERLGRKPIASPVRSAA